MQKFGNDATRLEFFRELLMNKEPSFAHHAAALLAAGGYFKKTILTTNFDKLVENAFARQGLMECQAIRTVQELAYWGQENNKAYVIKLHGDYDTNNIANTPEEVFMLSKEMLISLPGLLRRSGMLVVGAAGYEKSIYTLLDQLSSQTSERVLDFGLLWGVYMGPNRPAKLDLASLESKINDAVGRDIIQLMERMSPRNQMFAFFPVWGAGKFLLDLIRRSEDPRLIARAQSHMDHEMRLRQVFAAAGLKPDAIEKHLERLRRQRSSVDKIEARSSRAEVVYAATAEQLLSEVRIVYGDITSPEMLSDSQPNTRRAVVSPEDTCISAGGGVAYRLLREAGQYTILNELAKFQPVEHGTVAATSGGDLPVHYIFHAAALKIDADGNYLVSKENVASAVEGALRLSQSLQIGVLWIPLIASGVANLSPAVSLTTILECVRAWRPEHSCRVNIVIFGDGVLPRTEARELASETLGAAFSTQMVA
jgi:O-acetyl-ADP-ribose deacetylase (regulator of RNase III)